MFPAADYLDFQHTAHAAMFTDGEPVWSVLSRIAEYLLCLFRIDVHVGGAERTAIPIEQGLESHEMPRNPVSYA